MSKTLNLIVDVDPEGLANSIVSGLNRDDLFSLIVQLDAEMADWDFTERLYAYFAKQHELYLTEVAADAAENK